MKKYLNKINFSRSLVILVLFIVFTAFLAIPLLLLVNEGFIPGFNLDMANALSYFFPLLLTIFASYKIFVINNEDENESMWSYFSFTIGKKEKYFQIILISLVMILWVDFFTSLIPMPDWIARIFEEALNLSIPNIITVTLFAPFLEETLVRGLVLPGYLNNYSVKKSIVLSAVFFGIIHLNPWQFVGGFISGIFLGYLYYKTKSLSASIFVHFFNNSLSVLMMKYYPDIDTSFREIIGNTYYFIILVISIPALYLLLKSLNNNLNKEYNTITYEISNSN